MYKTLFLGIFLLSACNTQFAQTATSVACPNIRINEPTRLTRNGDTLEFQLEGDLKDLKDSKIEWKVSEGTIERGQGTPNIVVRTNLEPLTVYTISAEGSISGFPELCPNVFYGNAPVGVGGDPIIIDEWGSLPVNDQKGRFDNVLEELRRNPNNTGVFVLMSKKGSSEVKLLKRVKFIRDFVFGYRKFPKNRIIIASKAEPHDINALRIYRIPTEVVSAFCTDCRIH
jgi:hypothetical protein